MVRSSFPTTSVRPASLSNHRTRSQFPSAAASVTSHPKQHSSTSGDSSRNHHTLSNSARAWAKSRRAEASSASVATVSARSGSLILSSRCVSSEFSSSGTSPSRVRARTSEKRLTMGNGATRRR